MVLYFCLFFIIQCLLSVYGKEQLVTIDQGIVRGHKHATRDVYEFHGIPYATEPTGRSKFKESLPAPKLTGVFNATKKETGCPQVSFNGTINCLRINVIVPKCNKNLKPVFAYVHGGSFAYGFGNMLIPYNLAESGVIAVTFNYRLNTHGFLCLNTKNVPGNIGLKDQLAALRWIKRNIRAFGGNPNDITLGGFSAGAACAELLMLSPAANNLFNKVILESGSGMVSWAVHPKSLEFAQKMARERGVTNVENITALEEYYLSLSYSELSSMIFFPCVETAHENKETIITELPYKILQSGRYTKLPLLTGYTDAEGLLFYPDRAQFMAEMNQDFEKVLPPNYSFHAQTTEEEATKLIKKFYFNNELVTDALLRNYTDYYTDSQFLYWVVESAKRNVHNSAPVYLYEYSYVKSQIKLNGTGLGADHCAQSLIINESFPPIENEIYDADDLIVQNRTVNMWANFIKYGKPTPVGCENYWEPLDVEKMNYLDINLDIQKKTFPAPERIKLWDNIWFKRN